MSDRERPFNIFPRRKAGKFGAEGNNVRIVVHVWKEIVHSVGRSIGVGCTQHQYAVKLPFQWNGPGISLYDVNVVPPIRRYPSSCVDGYFGTDFHSNHFSGRPDCFDQVRKTAARSTTNIEYTVSGLKLKCINRSLPQCFCEEQVKIGEWAYQVYKPAKVRGSEFVGLHLGNLFSPDITRSVGERR